MKNKAEPVVNKSVKLAKVQRTNVIDNIVNLIYWH